MKVSVAASRPKLYPDRHLNVFVPYGTHDLDYNLTRALICTLRWSRPGLVQDFLSQIMGIGVADDVSLLYDLQACDYEDYDPEACEVKKVLGISAGGAVAKRLPPLDSLNQRQVLGLLREPGTPQGRLDGLQKMIGDPELSLEDLEVLQHTLEEYESGSMPDGWIFTADGQACVLIEAKLTQLLDQHQLDRHAETWFGEACRDENLVLATWEQIAGFVAGYIEDSDPQTAFLTRQLLDYLEILGQSPFSGFKPYDLDGDALHGTLPKLRRFVGQVRDRAFENGIGLASKPVTRGTGVTLAFADPGKLGAISFELGDDSISFNYSIGAAVEGVRLAGPEGADALLGTLGDEPSDNPLAGVEIATEEGWTVSVQRLARNEQGGFSWDNTVFEDELKPGDFLEVLEEFRAQHPSPDIRAAQGRSGLLVISRCLMGEELLTGAKGIVGEAIKAVGLFDKVARSLRLQTVPDDSDEG